jgi:Arc/MetJ family transcription regulator
MVRRTTIEIDDDLLARARKALGKPTTRATVEEALRRALAGTEGEAAAKRSRQMMYLQTLGDHVDLEVLLSDEMWR